MTTSERVRYYAREVGHHSVKASEELYALAEEVAELEKRQVPDGWMPYRLVHEVTEAEVFVNPDGWWVEPEGDPEKVEWLGDFRLPFQEAIGNAEVVMEKTA